MGGATANDIGSLGLNRIPGPVGHVFNALTWAVPGLNLIKGAGAIQRTAAGMNTPQQTVADNMGKLQEQQTAQAADAKKDLLLQPKVVAPDNFLADQASKLANLRKGLASTMTGAGGAPAPILSSPSLVASGGKTKLGS